MVSVVHIPPLTIENLFLPEIHDLRETPSPRDTDFRPFRGPPHSSISHCANYSTSSPRPTLVFSSPSFTHTLICGFRPTTQSQGPFGYYTEYCSRQQRTQTYLPSYYGVLRAPSLKYVLMGCFIRRYCHVDTIHLFTMRVS